MMVCNSPQFHQSAYHTNAKRAIFDLITSDIPFKKNSNFMCVYTHAALQCTHIRIHDGQAKRHFSNEFHTNQRGVIPTLNSLSLSMSFTNACGVFMCECVNVTVLVLYGLPIYQFPKEYTRRTTQHVIECITQHTRPHIYRWARYARIYVRERVHSTTHNIIFESLQRFG